MVLPVAVSVSVPLVDILIGAPLVPVMLMVELVSVRVRVPEVEASDVKLCVLLPVTNVPAVTVTVPNVTPPVNDVVSPAFPYASEAQAAVEAIVQVPVPLLASNVTLSAEVGGPAPLPPPELVDQFVVVALSQVGLFPTEKYAAILRHRLILRRCLSRSIGLQLIVVSLPCRVLS